MAVTIIVRATYTEERALEKFFTEIFGWGKSTILVRNPAQETIGVLMTDAIICSGNAADSNAPSPDSCDQYVFSPFKNFCLEMP